MRTISEIIIHCSATPEGKDYTVSDIDRWHKARGFCSPSGIHIGYHFVIYRDGSIHPGRPLSETGAHAGSSHNPHSIGVCYIGGVDAKNSKIAKDTRTEAQKASLLSLLKDLKTKFPEARILGHRDTSPDLNHDGVISKNEWLKACPSFDAASEYAHL